ncbi:unnamed protein product [Soboliphyme baturini]|uniref:Uncharacterized protein n=1 Tax=Soboliphyme baturini TaxID=241478 RepID=A0A183J0M9_9BILA|nr:unnamed protein product [Soboliphyme baturini]
MVKRPVVDRVVKDMKNLSAPCRRATVKTVTPTEAEIMSLKTQLAKQDSEIQELKNLIETLVMKKEAENGSDRQTPLAENDKSIEIMSTAHWSAESVRSGKEQSTSNSRAGTSKDPGTPEVACQTDGVCPHCNSPLSLSSLCQDGQGGRLTVAQMLQRNRHSRPSGDIAIMASPSNGNLANKNARAVEAQSKTSVEQCQRNSLVGSEQQFINDMIVTAKKWLKSEDHCCSKADKLYDSDRKKVPVPLCTCCRDASPLAMRPSPIDRYDTGDQDGNSLSMEVNALAHRYLGNMDVRANYDSQFNSVRPRMPTSSNESPNTITLKRRQHVLTEEISLFAMPPAGCSEWSLSSKQFMERYGLLPKGTVTNDVAPRCRVRLPFEGTKPRNRSAHSNTRQGMQHPGCKKRGPNFASQLSVIDDESVDDEEPNYDYERYHHGWN